jgi:hypothetical protein
VTGDDPNKAYEVVPIEPGQHGPPHAWWTVKRNGRRPDAAGRRGWTWFDIVACLDYASSWAGILIPALDIHLQPRAARLIDPDPSRGVAGYINDQQLVLISDARFQSV